MNIKLATRVMQAGDAAVQAAAECLAAGGLVAFPTETVYGVGADATRADAVARLFAAKGRPRFNPLIAHVADVEAAKRLARLGDQALRLGAAFWPGALTIVAPQAPDCSVCDLATAGLDTIAVRVSDHPVVHQILAAFGKPIVAPSANQSGHVSPTLAAHVRADLSGRIDLIVDGGPARVGVESTIVACLDDVPVLLRAGGVARADIERVLGRKLLDHSTQCLTSPTAPGMLASHYAPKARLRLDVRRVAPGEALLGFGPSLPEGAENATTVLNLSANGDLVEAAANLFAHLRELDASGAAVIAVGQLPRSGLGEAINDRLTRAAAPRGR